MHKLLEFSGNHLLIVSLLAIGVIWMVVEELRHQGIGGGRKSPSQIIDLINREDAVVLDLRSADDFKEGRIAGAISVPLAEFGKDLKKLEKYKKRPVIVTCQNGQKSVQIMHKLKKLGYTAYVLGGGVAAWKGANLPLVTK
jgi:rhodanese-related sulfurtransferase